MSVEGQADYFAAKSCLVRVFKKMNWLDSSLDQDFLYNCLLRPVDQDVCNSVLNSVLKTMNSYTQILKQYYNLDSEFSTLERSAYSVQDSLVKAGEYPSLQCRFDTMIAGIANMDRPSCWFKEE